MYLSTLNQQKQSSNRGDCTIFLSVNRDYCAMEDDNFISQAWKIGQVGLFILGVGWFG